MTAVPEPSDTLAREADWLDEAHANSADKGYSDEYRKGFKAAAGWVRFHSEHPGTLPTRKAQP